MPPRVGRLFLGLEEMSHLEAGPSGSSGSSTFSGWRLFLLEILWLLRREKRGGQVPHILSRVTSAPSFLTSLPENSHGGLGVQQGSQSDLTGRPMSRASPGADSGTPGPIPVELLTPLARKQGCHSPALHSTQLSIISLRAWEPALSQLTMARQTSAGTWVVPGPH